MGKIVQMEMNLNKKEFDEYLNELEKAGKLPKEGIDKLRKMNAERIEPLCCTRCHHKWIPRSSKIPKVCPNCNSPYWNKERMK